MSLDNPAAYGSPALPPYLGLPAFPGSVRRQATIVPDYLERLFRIGDAFILLGRIEKAYADLQSSNTDFMARGEDKLSALQDLMSAFDEKNLPAEIQQSLEERTAPVKRFLKETWKKRKEYWDAREPLFLFW